jgi:hypothetical protein
VKLVLFAALLATGTAAPAYVSNPSHVAHSPRVHPASTDPGVRCFKRTDWPPSLVLSVVGGNSPHKVGVPIRLRAIARDRDGDRLAYTWVVSGGHLDGVATEPMKSDKPDVTWSGGEAGSYTVTAEIDDHHGCMNMREVTFSVVN